MNAETKHGGAVDVLAAWLAGVSLSTVRDYREERGLQAGWKTAHARIARLTAKGTQARRNHVLMAIECRHRVLYLDAALANIRSAS